MGPHPATVCTGALAARVQQEDDAARASEGGCCGKHTGARDADFRSLSASRPRPFRSSLSALTSNSSLQRGRPAGNEVFHLGSSDPRDRTVLVVEAWAAAKRKVGPLPTLVIGGALGDLTADVQGAAAAAGVDVRLTGRLADGELADHLRQAAVVVQPSSDEGFGLQPLEAMASGAPVVVTPQTLSWTLWATGPLSVTRLWQDLPKESSERSQMRCAYDRQHAPAPRRSPGTRRPTLSCVRWRGRRREPSDAS